MAVWAERGDTPAAPNPPREPRDPEAIRKYCGRTSVSGLESSSRSYASSTVSIDSSTEKTISSLLSCLHHVIKPEKPKRKGNGKEKLASASKDSPAKWTLCNPNRHNEKDGRKACEIKGHHQQTRQKLEAKQPEKLEMLCFVLLFR